MLAFFRRLLDTWIARAFFVVLIASFALWGVADVVRNLGRETAVATVGDQKIEVPEFQDAFRQQLAQYNRMLGGRIQPTPAIRQGVAAQVLDQLVTVAAITGEVRRLGVGVSDEAVRRTVFDMPEFRGLTGTFERPRFDMLMRSNNLTEQRFLDQVRLGLERRQLMEAVQAGVAAPEPLLRQWYAFDREQRVAELVELPFTAAPDPGQPTPADLQRVYENNPAAYSSAATRRIQVVVLSPETVARDIQVPDEDVRTYFEQHKAEFTTEEKRSVEVVIAQDEAVAQRLATAWLTGTDWAEVQRQAEAAGAATTTLDDVTRAEFPAPDLAAAAFGAAPDTVAGPVHTAFGWQVLRVTRVLPGAQPTLEQAAPEVRAKIAQALALDQVYARSGQLEDALSAGTPLDRLPSDLGAVGLEGTLDAQGNTAEGQPAPLPGSPALRQAILTAAFALTKGEPPRLVEGPDQSYFAVQVEDLSPPELRPLAEVEGRVREDWAKDVRRRAQEVVAARLLAAAKAGGGLDDAATVAGLRAQRTPAVGRNGAPAPGMPAALRQALFGLRQGDATMVETPEGFLVARLAEVAAPDAAADPAGAAQIRTALAQDIGRDVEITYAVALRDRAKPRVNRQVLDSVAQP